MGALQAVVLGLVLLTSCVTRPVEVLYGGDITRAFARDLTESAVYIRVQCEEEAWTGSGVILDADVGHRTLVATAHHVADPTCEIRVRDRVFKVVSSNEEYDAALLLGPRLKGTPRGLSPKPYVGEEVIAVGFPWQQHSKRTGLQITRGQLSAFLDRRYKMNAHIAPGSSGGPVYDRQGRLIGLSVSRGLSRFRMPLAGEFYVTPAEKVFEMSVRFTRNFKVAELSCKCGAPVPVRYYPNAAEVTRRAQVLRDFLGYPVKVVSGYRTPDYNAKVGGAPRSRHLTAEALDIRSYHYHPLELKAAYEALIESGKVPDGGLGTYDRWIHIDTGPARRWDGRSE